MRNLLIVLTVVEIVLVIAVLAFYLNRISASLYETARHLAKVTYGVRAVETQCSSIGPSVVKINEQLATDQRCARGSSGPCRGNCRQRLIGFEA